jgi:hypothetical protein
MKKKDFKYLQFYVLTTLLFLSFMFVTSAVQSKQNNAKKPGNNKLTDDQLLDMVQKQTFKYFWDLADPYSGMAKERNTEEWVTIGGTGFGVMTIPVGIERGYITRKAGVKRMLKIVSFLDTCDRFHGVWPHWLYGKTGKIKSFSEYDNGGDLVETAFLIQGLLAVKEYFNRENPEELLLSNKIQKLWEEVEWDWYRQNGQNVLFWHWSPNHGWKMNMPIRGWNEALIVYVLAVSSPTHGVPPEVYHKGWANSDYFINGNIYEGIKLPLGFPYGGPLFFAHYSFLGLNPNGLNDRYADYFVQNKSHTLINYNYCKNNPKSFKGYSDKCWGLTASDDPLVGYLAHEPGNNDNGTISPTAAVSSIVYTPQESLSAIRYFYEELGDRLWGDYGFKDAFNLKENWFANTYLAIDQGPIVVMIENYRTGLLWKNFMNNKDVQKGLNKLGFNFKK